MQKYVNCSPQSIKAEIVTDTLVRASRAARETFGKTSKTYLRSTFQPTLKEKSRKSLSCDHARDDIPSTKYDPLIHVKGVFVPYIPIRRPKR